MKIRANNFGKMCAISGLILGLAGAILMMVSKNFAFLLCPAEVLMFLGIMGH